MTGRGIGAAGCAERRRTAPDSAQLHPRAPVATCGPTFSILRGGAASGSTRSAQPYRAAPCLAGVRRPPAPLDTAHRRLAASTHGVGFRGADSRLESHRQPSDQGFLLGDLFGGSDGVSVRGSRWSAGDVHNCRMRTSADVARPFGVLTLYPPACEARGAPCRLGQIRPSHRDPRRPYRSCTVRWRHVASTWQ